MSAQGTLLFHVDVDSPRKLLQYYGADPLQFSDAALLRFYETAMDRAMEFFHLQGSAASFFVVGDELGDPAIQKVIRKAHDLGHEIENHSFSHLLGLSRADTEVIKSEIDKCSNVVAGITGRRPAGFRSPGYSVNGKLIEILRELGFMYDSSGFWSFLNPMLRAKNSIFHGKGLAHMGFGAASNRLPANPYTPAEGDWLKPASENGGFWELPLPRTFCDLPFYNNFNLWAPGFYNRIVSRMIRSRCVVYLFHLVEFMDMSDGLPGAVSAHPNLKVRAGKKIAKSNQILNELKKKYKPASTMRFLRTLEGAGKNQ